MTISDAEKKDFILVKKLKFNLQFFLKALRKKISFTVSQIKYFFKFVDFLRFFIPTTLFLVFLYFFLVGIEITESLKWIGLFPLVNTQFGLSGPWALSLPAQLNPVIVIIYLGVVTMRGFFKSTTEKFAEKVESKEKVIYIFGASIFSEDIVQEMVSMALTEKIALISEKDLLWVKETSKKGIDVLIEEKKEEFERSELYKTIGFKNAEKILILSEDKVLNQNIFLHVRKQNPNVGIVMLERLSPPFIEAIGGPVANLQILKDVDAVTRDLILSLSLEVSYAPVLWMQAPPSFVGEKGTIIKDVVSGIEVLKIKRGNDLIDPSTKILRKDQLLLYIHDEKDLPKIISLLG